MQSRAVYRLGVLLAFMPLSFADATPTILHFRSEQGVPVYLVSRHELEMLDLRVIWNAGSAHDGKQSGIAALTAGMLKEGADGMDARQLNRGFESVGAILTTGVTRDHSTLSLRSRSTPSALQQALDHFKRVIETPDFPRPALQRQIGRTLIDIKADKQSARWVARRAFYATIYGRHPYATPIKGTADTLPTVRRQDVVDFHRRHYTTGNAALVMVGDISEKQARFVASTLFINVRRDGPPISPLAKVPEPQPGPDVFIPHPAEQTHVLIGQTVMARKDTDYFPLYVGNHILGGGGMVSRLFETIREERGLSYSVYSYFFPFQATGPFMANLQTKAAQAREAQGLLIENIRRFTETGPSETELDAAKRHIIGGFPLKISNNSQILDYVTLIACHDLPLDYLSTFPDRVQALTTQDIQDAFQRRLKPEALRTILVGPRDGEPDATIH